MSKPEAYAALVAELSDSVSDTRVSHVPGEALCDPSLLPGMSINFLETTSIHSKVGVPK